MIRRPASTPTPKLASMDKIVADCENYFLQSRMIPQQSQIQARMENLLLGCVGTQVHSFFSTSAPMR